MEINYGTGDCDAKAMVTKGGESKEIILQAQDPYDGQINFINAELKMHSGKTPWHVRYFIL